MIAAESPPTRARGTKPGIGHLARAALVGLVILAATAIALLVVHYHDEHGSVSSIRPAGVPQDVSTSLANLMALNPVPSHSAPAFTLTDQDGRTLSLSSFQGHPVVLEFMDPHCTDICPIVSQELVDAYHDLDKSRPAVVFLAINVNPYHLGAAAVAAFSKEHRLDDIPTWHFLTGPLPVLRSIWSRYGIEVQARGPNADVVHSSIVYFIGPSSNERFIAAPTDDHTKSGTAYLPGGQLSAWGRGIAQTAADIRH